MSNTFVFNSAGANISNSSLTLNSGTFYAHLVTSLPNQSSSVVGDVPIATYTGYAPVVASNVSFTTIFKFDDLVFPSNQSISPQTVIGYVLASQLGSSPASTDPVILFSYIKQSNINVSVVLNAYESITIKIDQVNGVLGVLTKYLFRSGSFVTNFDTNGSIYTIGSKNNTEDYFTNNNPNTPLVDLYVGLPSTHTSALQPNPNLTHDMLNKPNVNGTGMSLDYRYMSFIDFKAIRYNLQNSNLWLRYVCNNYVNTPISLYGAQSLPDFTPSVVNVLDNWDLLGSGTLIADQYGLPGTMLLPITGNATYYKFLGLLATNVLLMEFDFYNTTLASDNANCT